MGSGRMLGRFGENCSGGVALSPDGQTAVYEAGTFWDVASGELLDKVNLGGHVIYSPDGKLLACRASLSTGEDAVRFWDAKTKELVRECKFPQKDLRWALSSDWKRINLAGRDGKLWTIDSATGQIVHAVDKRAGHIDSDTYEWSPNGNRVAVRVPGGSGRGALQLLDTGTGKMLKEFDLMELANDPPVRCTWSPDGKTVAAGCGSGRIYVFDVVTGRIRKMLGGHMPGHFCNLTWLADGKTVISDHTTSAHSYSYAASWDTSTGKCVAVPFGGRNVARSPDGKLYVSAHRHSHVQTIPLGEKGEAVFRAGPDDDESYGFAWSWNSKVLASSDSKGNVTLRESPTGRQLKSLSMPAGLMAALSPDGKKVLIARGNSSPVFDTETGKQVGSMPYDGAARIRLMGDRMPGLIRLLW